MARIGILAAFIAAVGCGGEQEMASDFFRQFQPTELGTTKIVSPGPTGLRGEPIKMLRLNTEDGLAALVSFSFRSEYDLGQPQVSGFPPPAGEGTLRIGAPLMGKIRWGIGGAYSEIEFDIPAGRLPDIIRPTVPGAQPASNTGNGTTITLAGSAFEVTVIHDGNLHPTRGAGNAASEVIGNPFEAKVMAMAHPWLGGKGHVRRTIYVCYSDVTGPGSLPAATQTSISIPMFAKRVYFPRADNAVPPANVPPLQVNVLDNTNTLIRAFNVSANQEGPFEVFPNEVTMAITNSGANDLRRLEAVFDVDPS